MYLEGYSYTEIINALNSRGYRTRRGLPFAKNSLYEILRNERYTGTYLYVKDATKNPKGKYVRHGKYDPEAVIRIPRGMPQIISPEDFDRVQAKMKERQHKAAKFSAKQEYLLSGKIYCGECGSPYAGNSRRPRPDHPMYVSYKCTRRNQRAHHCKSPEINRDKLEQIVLERLSKFLFNPDVIPRLVDEYHAYIENKTGSSRERLDALRSELRTVERKITNAVNLMIETGSAAIKDKLRELEESKEKLSFTLSEAKVASNQNRFSEAEIRRLFHVAEQQLKNGTLANRRAVIDQYIDKILIYPDQIEVYINFISDYVVKEIIEQ